MNRSSISLGLVALSIFALSACNKQDAGGANDDNSVYAVVNGKDIKGKDVNEKVKNDLSEVKRQEYEIKRRATEEMVQQVLVEDEAKKQGTTVDKIFSQFDALKNQDVTKDDVAAFLKQRNIDEKKLTKQERESVPQFIKMLRMNEGRQKFVADLRAKANVQFKIPRPAEPKLDVTVGDGTPRGPATAKVAVVEFSDFQCPFCARGRQRVDEIEAKYKDKIKIYFRNFPLESIHPNAFHAAEAAACAKDQGKFWEFHNVLFDHQDKLDDKSYVEDAKTLGMDTKAFQDCLKANKHQVDIRKDMEEAQKYGVNSTPTFFVNGRAVRGAQPIEAFSEIIDEELSK